MNKLIFLVLFTYSLRMLQQASAPSNPDQVPGGKCQSTNSLQITLQYFNGGNEKKTVKVLVRNISGTDLYVVTDTRRANRTMGPYWYADQAAKNVIVAGFILYEPDGLFSDYTHARLLLLHPQQTYSTQIDATLPIRETVPPYSAFPYPRTFDKPQVTGIRVEVAYFPFSEKLQKLSASRPSGVVVGADTVETGAAARSIAGCIAASQCVVSSSVLDLTAAPSTPLQEPEKPGNHLQ